MRALKPEAPLSLSEVRQLVSSLSESQRRGLLQQLSNYEFAKRLGYRQEVLDLIRRELQRAGKEVLNPKYEVTVTQRIQLPFRKEPELVERYFKVSAKSAKSAAKAVRDSGVEAVKVSVRELGPEVGNPKLRLQCGVCQQKFATSRDLLKHQREQEHRNPTLIWMKPTRPHPEDRRLQLLKQLGEKAKAKGKPVPKWTRWLTEGITDRELEKMIEEMNPTPRAARRFKDFDDADLQERISEDRIYLQENFPQENFPESQKVRMMTDIDEMEKELVHRAKLGITQIAGFERPLIPTNPGGWKFVVVARTDKINEVKQAKEALKVAGLPFRVEKLGGWWYFSTIRPTAVQTVLNQVFRNPPSEVGRKGGLAVYQKYGPEHMAAIGRKGFWAMMSSVAERYPPTQAQREKDVPHMAGVLARLKAKKRAMGRRANPKEVAQ